MEIMITFSIFGVMMLLMALGVMFTGRPLKGSCGGVGGECPCDDAGTPGVCKLPQDGGEGTQQTEFLEETSEGIKLYG